MATIEKIFIGRNAEEAKVSPKVPKYSKITLDTEQKDEDGIAITYSAGDDTGETFTINCVWATQEMANNVYALLKDFEYQPYEATDAIIDPAAEIGDAVGVAGVYGMIFNREIDFDHLFTETIAAPFKDETEDEYPYTSATQRTASRLESELKGVAASLVVTKTSIEAVVTNGEADTAKIIAAINREGSYANILASKIGLTGAVTFSDLENKNGHTVINGGNITTGTIDASRVRVSNSFQVLIDKGGVTSEGESILEPAGYIGAATGSTSVVVWFDGVEEYDENGNVIKHGTVGTVKGYKTATTYGVAMSASTDRVTENTRDPYVIVTDKGARISAGGAALLVTNGAVMYRHNSNDEWQKVGSGTATFG